MRKTRLRTTTTAQEEDKMPKGLHSQQPIMVTVPVRPSMSVNGARFSRFFDVFAAGGSHEGFLKPSELRLVSEWLDIGGQYYNNPFDAPED